MAFNALQRGSRSPMQIRRYGASFGPSAMREGGGPVKRWVASLGPVWAVIGILRGMVGVAGCIGIHTAKQQLFHSPSVQVTKKRRECVPEVENPDAVIRSADKFENKSFLRKVAHIQDNPNRPDPSTRSREVETLKSVGVHN